MCQTGLFKAIKLFGSQQAVAKLLNVTQQAVSYWLNGTRQIPDTLALTLFIAAKGHIPLSELTHSSEMLMRTLHSAQLFMKFPAVTMALKDINTNHLVCQKYKKIDLEILLENKDQSLLSEPILVDKQNRLIVCECRIRAHRLLGKQQVLVHKIDLYDVVNDQVSIEIFTQHLPVSERVFVGCAIERVLIQRWGKKLDFQKVDKSPPLKPKLKSRTVAASIAGFSSDFLYRQAKKVVEKGSCTLIHAMDKKIFKISQAKKIALLPEGKQKEVLSSILAQRQIH